MCNELLEELESLQRVIGKIIFTSKKTLLN